MLKSDCPCLIPLPLPSACAMLWQCLPLWKISKLGNCFFLIPDKLSWLDTWEKSILMLHFLHNWTCIVLWSLRRSGSAALQSGVYIVFLSSCLLWDLSLTQMIHKRRNIIPADELVELKEIRWKLMLLVLSFCSMFYGLPGT